MKRVLACLCSVVLLLLCACAPAKEPARVSLTATVNGKTVSTLPYLYYGRLNRDLYSRLLSPRTEEDFKDIVAQVTLNNYLTYFAVLDEAEAQNITLTDEDKVRLEEDFQAYLDRGRIDVATDEEIREILAVYYLQEHIRATFTPDEATISAEHKATYDRFRTVFFTKYDAHGEIFDAETLDETEKTAYTVYARLSDGSLTFADAVKTYSTDYVDPATVDEDLREQVNELNNVLINGFLITTDGFYAQSTEPMPDDVVSFVAEMNVGDMALYDSPLGWWILERLDENECLAETHDEVAFHLASRAFNVWLSEKIDGMIYLFSDDITDYIFSRP